MNLIKHEKGNKNGCPRWVYENNNHIIKTIPFKPAYNLNVGNQIKLINEVSDTELILSDYKIEDNKFLTYKMNKIPYQFDLEENIVNEASFDGDTFFFKNKKFKSIYTDIDLYLENILVKYVKVNLKLFPYYNIDGGYGNILQYDIGKWIIIDWDDCILGNKCNSQDIGKYLMIETVESIIDLIECADIKDIKNYYQKAIKFYKKMTLNTVLENCEFNLEELAIKSYINIADSKEN
jgi:hypothetical protein